MRRLFDIVLSVDKPALFAMAIEEYWSTLGLFPRQVVSEHQTLWQVPLDISLTKLVDVRALMVHGTEIIKETVNCLNEFDQRFVEAAKLIAEQQPRN